MAKQKKEIVQEPVKTNEQVFDELHEKFTKDQSAVAKKFLSKIKNIIESRPKDGNVSN